MNHRDVLFIHPSAHTSSPHFIVMPMGVVSLMNTLRDYTVSAVNVGLEMCLNKSFDLKQFLKGQECDFVGIDLHWHEHAYSSLDIARMCKRVNPDTTVFLGGFTASYFAEEILQATDNVDIIVRGEAEEAVPQVVQKKELSSIPNLAYRDNGHIKKTPVTPPHSLDDLDFSNIQALYHWEEYLKASIHNYAKTRFWYDFWLCTGRGCVYECSYCGGAHSAQKNLCMREEMTFRSVDAVIRDLVRLKEMGVHVVCPSHDISLAGKPYWQNLFAKMKKEDIYMGMYLEVWQLPDKEFIEELASVCDPRFTTVAITLLSGSESVRKENGKYFSNQEFFDLIKTIEKCYMNYTPYFATGLPFETRETFEETLMMTEDLLSHYHPSTVFCTPLRLDPGSPMYENPHKYKIMKHFHSFSDYYNKCRKRAKNLPYDPTGYHTEFLDGKSIIKMQHEWESVMVTPMGSGSSMDTLHFV